MIAWGSPNGVPLTPTDHRAMEAALDGHSWFRAFPGAVVVALESAADRSDIQGKLTEASRALDPSLKRVHVLISPAITPEAGTYGGLLPSAYWEQLNEKSKPPAVSS